jgi:hypothetical protein
MQEIVAAFGVAGNTKKRPRFLAWAFAGGLLGYTYIRYT